MQIVNNYQAANIDPNFSVTLQNVKWWRTLAFTASSARVAIDNGAALACSSQKALVCNQGRWSRVSFIGLGCWEVGFDGDAISSVGSGHGQIPYQTTLTKSFTMNPSDSNTPLFALGWNYSMLPPADSAATVLKVRRVVFENVGNMGAGAASSARLSIYGMEATGTGASAYSPTASSVNLNDNFDAQVVYKSNLQYFSSFTLSQYANPTMFVTVPVLPAANGQVPPREILYMDDSPVKPPQLSVSGYQNNRLFFGLSSQLALNYVLAFYSTAPAMTGTITGRVEFTLEPY